MPNKDLRPPGAASDSASDGSSLHDKEHEIDALRLLSRTPQPYHHQNSDKFALSPPSSIHFAEHDGDSRDGGDLSPTAFPNISREQTPSSCSGTEADDEHFLKGLPAPKQRLHKGLRGRNEMLSGTSTPIPSPAILEEEGRGMPHHPKKGAPSKGSRAGIDGLRRRKEIIRRLCELLIIGTLGITVQANSDVKPILRRWNRELYVAIGVMTILVLLYPLRIIIWAFWYRTPSRSIPISIPTTFDPAPLLYPPTITLFVSSLIAVDNEAVLLPNLVLALSSLPAALIPAAPADLEPDPLHWILSCLPLFLSGSSSTLTNVSSHSTVSAETITLLYPLHLNLYVSLHTLTTTSLLPAELQLLSIALINVLLLSSSPQAIILKAGLWVGGLDLLAFCSRVVLWGIALARVPKWRFKRTSGQPKSRSTFLRSIIPWRKVRHDIFHASLDSSSCSSDEGHDDQDDSDDLAKFRTSTGGLRVNTINFEGPDGTGVHGQGFQAVDGTKHPQFNILDRNTTSPLQRRHTLPSGGDPPRKSHAHTPSGRRKRSASSSVRAFFSLTQEEAAVRKWQYAAYVYICIGAALFAPIPFIGILEVVKTQALHGNDALGWALGYMLGDLPAFRWQVVSHNLERWTCLPERLPRETIHKPDSMGWATYLRHSYFGEANTRLLMCAYCITVIAVGLMVVFRLSPFYEVDTRRKVFHFMMVTMFLPLTYVDPTFVALAFTIILVLFLLLDLLRASQLPPLSKPLASFLAPYVDGRDLRGPVVVSHIFLLIGCAIPLWLSLATLPRTGAGYAAGWEVPSREVAMVAGVVCVGLGDAAASLIGRRYGYRKWLWGGGKSLEGSVAFALAVFLGLFASHAWLRLGGWMTPASNGGSGSDRWGVTLTKMGACATMASFTEAVLTGGNDNVIVPVVLWTCVKSLGV